MLFGAEPFPRLRQNLKAKNWHFSNPFLKHFFLLHSRSALKFVSVYGSPILLVMVTPQSFAESPGFFDKDKPVSPDGLVPLDWQLRYFFRFDATFVGHGIIEAILMVLGKSHALFKSGLEVLRFSWQRSKLRWRDSAFGSRFVGRSYLQNDIFLSWLCSKDEGEGQSGRR
jgi:hypothetical protein